MYGYRKPLVNGNCPEDYPYVGALEPNAESGDISEAISVTTTPEEPLLRRIDWRWDRATGVLCATATLWDGQSYAIGFPVARVSMLFDQFSAEEGVPSLPDVSGYASVDGLFRKIRRGIKKASRKAKRAVKKTTRKLGRKVGKVARGVGKTAAKVARSKALGGALLGASALMPAVGGPALAAWTAANRAVSAVDKAKALKRRGIRAPREIARGRRALRAIKALGKRSRKDRRVRLLMGAMRSLR